MEHAERRNGHARAIFYIVLSAFFYAVVDVVSRFAGSEVPAITKVFIRNAVVTVFSAGLLVKSGNYFRFQKKNTGWFVLRAAFGIVVSFCNIYAIDHMVVADATMIHKLSPFFVILFSFLLLKEKINAIQIGVIAVGFLGAMFVVKPTGNITELVPALSALASAIALGMVYPCVRKLRTSGENASMIVFFFTAAATIVSFPFFLMQHARLAFWQVLLIMLSGVFNCLAQLAASAGYAICPAREISVYDYSQVIFAAILGFLCFRQVPDHMSFIGYVVIIGTSVFLFLYERNRGAEKS